MYRYMRLTADDINQIKLGLRNHAFCNDFNKGNFKKSMVIQFKWFSRDFLYIQNENEI